jgi:hypothetical protein
MGTYNRFKAKVYATHWALGRNPDYKDYSGHAGGGDCTNFISQCLFAGGWSMVNGFIQDPTAWFGPNPDSLAASISSHGGLFNSFTWSAVASFKQFLNLSGRAQICKVDELEIGDVVLMYSGGYVNPIHAMLVTGMQELRHMPTLSYHTTDRLDRPLSLIDVDNSILEYYKLKDSFPDFYLMNDKRYPVYK